MHWSKERAARQDLIAGRIAALGLSHVIVVRSTDRDEHPDRQRRKCLEQVCCEVAALGASRLVIESRGPADDRRDLVTMQSLRAQQRLERGLRMSHERGPAEPLLWIADAVCGAFHGGGVHWELLRESCSVIDISPWNANPQALPPAGSPGDHF